MVVSFAEIRGHKYHQVLDGDEPLNPDISEPINNLRCWRLTNHLHFLSRPAFPWTVSAILAIFSVYLLSQEHDDGLLSHCAFPTDLADVRPSIAYEERVFSGKLGYNKETGFIFRETGATQPQYFGEPSPDIDAAWADLLWGEFPVMTDEEARPYNPELKKLPTDGQYHFELDVFHSLHCLNAIRKTIDKEYYSEHDSMHMDWKNLPHVPPDWDRIHIDHCLEQIRQSIQCNADLSPVPMFSWDGVPLALGVGQSHTCRKWGPIREWLDLRNRESTPLEEPMR